MFTLDLNFGVATFWSYAQPLGNSGMSAQFVALSRQVYMLAVRGRGLPCKLSSETTCLVTDYTTTNKK